MDAKIYLALFVCLAGLILWLVLSPAPKRPTFAEAGRIAYAFGLLVTLLVFAREVLRL